MKNKILSYLLIWVFALSMWFITSYTNAQADPVEKCKTDCRIGYGTDPAVNDCLRKCEKCPDWCCWIKLNTDFPIIWNCIWGDKEDGVDATNAFPTMLGAFTKIIMSVILVVCFVMVIYAGILRSANNPKEAKEWLTRVAITVALLWLSGVILKLINPNFFG